jgi:hypothetical protein
LALNPLNTFDNIFSLAGPKKHESISGIALKVTTEAVLSAVSKMAFVSFRTCIVANVPSSQIFRINEGNKPSSFSYRQASNQIVLVSYAIGQVVIYE